MTDSALTLHLATLLKRSDPGSEVSEDAYHPGFFTIDGWFNLDDVAEKIVDFINRTKKGA